MVGSHIERGCVYTRPNNFTNANLAVVRAYPRLHFGGKDGDEGEDLEEQFRMDSSWAEMANLV
jgi:hypothetical protein